MKRMGDLPKHWVGCPKMAIGLIGDKFFTFKTPLSPGLNKKLAPEGQFHPEEIIQEISKFNKRLGLWIDLTNTSRYYRPEIIQGLGVEYVKLALEGQVKPNKQQRANFASICDNFLSRYPAGVIGVHCTHGFNRTGFLICNYLMCRRKYNVHEAIMEFSQMRPPGIYRQNYIHDLYELSREQGSKSRNRKDIPPPPIVHAPPWASQREIGGNGRGGQAQGNWRQAVEQNFGRGGQEGNWRGQNPGPGVSWGRGGNSGRGGQETSYGAGRGGVWGRRMNQNGGGGPNNFSINGSNTHENHVFQSKRQRFDEDDYPPVVLPEYTQPINGSVFFEESVAHRVTPYNMGIQNRNTLLRILRHLCYLDDTGPLFPELTELDSNTVDSLSLEFGTVSWQSSGKRFLLFIQNKNQMFFIGEDEEIWCLQGMNFPSKRNLHVQTSDTVLFGEMTRIKAGEKDVPAFIISDILSLGGKYVGKLSLSTRRRCLKEEIIQPRGMAIQQRLFQSSEEPFGIRSKPYFTLEESSNLLNPAFPFRLSAPPAYLLFLHSTKRFQVGPQEQNGFRWKFPSEGVKCVDFLLRINANDRSHGDLLVIDDLNMEVKFSILSLISEELGEKLNGKIIECRFENGHWIFIRERLEAISPSSLANATDVQNGVKNTSSLDQTTDHATNSVSKEKLLDVISALLSSTSTSSN